MASDKKEKFFHEVVTERVKEEKLNGIYIIVCKDPSYLYVGTTGDAAFPSSAGSMIRQAMLASLRAKKFDEGLQRSLQIALDATGLGEKK